MTFIQSCILFLFGLAILAVSTLPVHSQTLTILTEEWKPVSFSENGKVKGLGVEVVQEIIKRLDSREKIQVLPWARAWELFMKRPNVVLFTMTRTDEREKLFTMIGPVAIGTTNFYSKKDRNIKISTLDDARKVDRIGVYRSAVEEQILTGKNFTNLDATALPVLSAKKLMTGRIDLWCNANLTAASILEDAGFSIDDVVNVFTISENHLYIALSRGTDEKIVRQWLHTLESIKEDGTFARIYHKWLPGEKVPQKVERIGLLN